MSKKYSKQYYKTHKEEIKKRSKEYYNSHKEEKKDYQRKYHHNNIEDRKIYKKKYDANNKEKSHKRFRNFDLKRKFGITVEQYKLMFDKQEGKCNICERHQNEFKRALAVDHDHKTGRIRGLLCYKCNQGLGHFNDDINLLLKAIEHLKNNE
jgi:hypothetical protein